VELNGQIDVFDWTDKETGLTVRLADFDLILRIKLESVMQAAPFVPAARGALEDFNLKVLNEMELKTRRKESEAPLYFWIRAMKEKNGLSFEDGVYEIPEHLAACIVRCPGARQFVRQLTGVLT